MPEDIFKRFRSQAPVEGTKLHHRRLRETDILAAVDRLPALPEIAQQILAKANDERAGAGFFQDLIGKDLVIAGRLLKLVNSPFYMLTNPVGSIQQAVTLVGMRTLRTLVVALSSKELFNVHLEFYGFQAKGLWLSSMVCAGLGQAIAKEAGGDADQMERAFVGGLLRDVGMLVLGPFLAAVGTHPPVAGTQDIVARERSAIDFDHAWVGERIAEKWALPEDIRQVIAWHHRIPKDSSAQLLRFLAWVRLAERLTFVSGVGLSPEHPFDTRVDQVLLEAAGLDAEALKRVLAQLPRIIETAKLEAA
jgi:HD-like signal output (HDOD) protein